MGTGTGWRLRHVGARGCARARAPQAREARRAAQAAAAADARTLFRREAEWVVKQPKARQAKSQVLRAVAPRPSC